MAAEIAIFAAVGIAFALAVLKIVRSRRKCGGCGCGCGCRSCPKKAAGAGMPADLARS